MSNDLPPLKRILVLALLMLAGFSFSQDHEEIKGLKNRLSQNITDSARIAVYNQLADAIADEEEWMKYNTKALELANKKLKQLDASNHKYYLRYKAEATANIGYYYDDHGDIDKSLQNYFKALEMYEEASYEEGKAGTLNNIGTIFLDQQEYKEAKTYFEKGLYLKKKYDPDNVAVNYINLGSVMEGLKDTAASLKYYELGLEAARKEGDNINMGTALTNIGTYHFKKDNYEQAIEITTNGLHHYKLGGDVAGQAWAMANIGLAHFNLRHIDSALYYNLEANEIANNIGFPELIEHVSGNLYKIYSDQKIWDKALEQFIINSAMVDSLRNVEVQKNALTQKLSYEHNLDKTTTSLRNKEDRKRSEQRMYFVLIGLGSAILFGIFMYSRLRITKRQKKTIEEQKKETEKQKEIILDKNKEIVDSINYAKRLQDAIFPTKEMVKSSFKSSFIIYKPKDIVAGDFYWMHHSEKHIYLAVADCTGHGVPGAMVSVVCANALERSVKEFELTCSGKILDKVTELVIETFEKSGEGVNDGMDIALFRLDTETNEIEFAGANNSLWISHLGKNEIEIIKGDRQPIGKYDRMKLFKPNKVNAQSGDWLYLFSDGYPDQFGGPEGKKFKSSQLKTLLEKNANKPAHEKKEILEEQLLIWKGKLEQVDDICFIGIEI